VLGMIGLLWMAWKWWDGQPLHHPPGVLVKEGPVQGPVPPGKTQWPAKGAVITPLASYDIQARVVHCERYRWDAVSDLSPLDVGVAWGVMSDETYLGHVAFSNYGRTLNWRSAEDDWPTGAEECLANMHMLPATDLVRERLLNLKPGQIMRARGYLVEVLRTPHYPWTSSLSRADTGQGACEIMWVESLTVSP
jgi:hypothetical protein